MDNMFSHNTKKEIPHTFEDCVKPDNVSSNLWIWCERLENWGQKLFYILIAIGLITGVVDFIVAWAEDMLEYTIGDILLGLVNWGLYAFLEYCAYHVLALLIGALATITQNTAITANVALYNARKQPNTDSTPSKSKVSEPQLPKKEVPKAAPPQNDVPKGLQKEEPKKVIAPSSFDHKESWVCDKCGKENDGFYLRCQGCGQFR